MYLIPIQVYVHLRQEKADVSDLNINKTKEGIGEKGYMGYQTENFISIFCCEILLKNNTVYIQHDTREITDRKTQGEGEG